MKAKIEVFVKGSIVIDLDDDNYDVDFAKEVCDNYSTVEELCDRLDGLASNWNFDNLKVVNPHEIDNYTFAMRDDCGNIIYSND